MVVAVSNIKAACAIDRDTQREIQTLRTGDTTAIGRNRTGIRLAENHDILSTDDRRAQQNNYENRYKKSLQHHVPLSCNIFY
jgi:hypothetical protein